MKTPSNMGTGIKHKLLTIVGNRNTVYKAVDKRKSKKAITQNTTKRLSSIEREEPILKITLSWKTLQAREKEKYLIVQFSLGSILIISRNSPKGRSSNKWKRAPLEKGKISDWLT